MASEIEALHPFHQANIHEHRWAAYAARFVPMLVLLVTVALVLVGVLYSTRLLLVFTAVCNVTMWLLVCSAATFGIIGSWTVHELVHEQGGGGPEEVPEEGGARPRGRVKHVVVLPNYDEGEAMLAETLTSLSEADGSSEFWIFLAMEEREGDKGKRKGERLVADFRERFERIEATFHPRDLVQHHADGSESPEVPGKASNLKHAVRWAHERCQQELDAVDACILTVADADCLFHPSYFHRVGSDFCTMRQCDGDQQNWTMWQAPQLPYRNYFLCPLPSRVWGYISSMWEFGGVASLTSGGQHMAFSAYSLSLRLAADADLWDGDVIAEDHHAFLKGFFYSVHAGAAATARAPADGKQPRRAQPCLRLRPVMVPVKSTSVLSADGCWATWRERWSQATRHCQGVAEVSYSLLVAWDMFHTLPWNCYSAHVVVTIIKVLTGPILMHLVPVCQAIAMTVLTVYWLANHRAVPECPDRIWMASADGQTLLCGLAGAWALTWPVAIPFSLCAVANFLFIRAAFMLPKKTKTRHWSSLWVQSDACIAPELAGVRVGETAALIGLIIVDCLFMPLVMAVYGFLAEIVGCWNVMVRGNQFTYVSAAKLTAAPAGGLQGYGATAQAEGTIGQGVAKCSEGVGGEAA